MNNFNRRDSICVNVVMYVLVLALCIYAIFMEKQDVSCPYPNASKEECELQGGMSFGGPHPSEDDSCDELLKKIDKAAGYEVNSVKWRRNFLSSVAITFVGTLIMNGSLPNWHIFYLYLIISFIILTAITLWYTYHVYRVAEGKIFDATDILRNKFCPNSVGDIRTRSGRHTQ